MLGEAIAAGLAVDPEKMETVLGGKGEPYIKPEPSALPHESLTGLWWLAEFLLKKHFDWARKEWRRRMNLGRRRTIPPGSFVHRAAYQRGPDYQKRLPPDAVIVD